MQITDHGLQAEIHGVEAPELQTAVAEQERALTALLDEHTRERGRIATDRGLTEYGKAERLAALREQHAAKLNQLENGDRQLARIVDEQGRRRKILAERLHYTPAADLRTLNPRIKKEGAPTALQREREIRDRLLALDDTQRFAVAMRAAGDDDLETLRAIADAPSSFPVLSPQFREQVDRAHIAAHHRDHLDRLEVLDAAAITLKSNFSRAREVLGVLADPLAPKAA